MRRLLQLMIMFLPVTITLALSALLIAQPGGNRPAPPHQLHQRATQQANNEPLPGHEVTITERDRYQTITANGIPDHAPGRFPNRGNPNTISAQDYTFRVTLEPKALDEPVAMRGYLFGVALNGVPFDPGTAEIWTPQGRRMMGQSRDYGWNYDALSGKIDLGIDEHHAHVQPTGAYHYHGLPTGLIEQHEAHEHDADGSHVMTLVGYAADGFPMYARFGYKDAEDTSSEVVELTSSYQLKDGERVSPPTGPGGAHDGTYVQDFEYVDGAGDLDECNGRFGVTPEYPGGTYYYVLTDAYPFVPRLFRGEPDASFRKARPGGGRGDPGGRVLGSPPGGRDGRRPPPPR